MVYCVATPEQGWKLKSECQWDGKDWHCEFRIKGIANFNYAKCSLIRRSVSGYTTFLKVAPVIVKS
eukprot:10527242-Ditylum_brightwellii.AAC.1